MRAKLWRGLPSDHLNMQLFNPKKEEKLSTVIYREGQIKWAFLERGRGGQRSKTMCEHELAFVGVLKLPTGLVRLKIVRTYPWRMVRIEVKFVVVQSQNFHARFPKEQSLKFGGVLIYPLLFPYYRLLIRAARSTRSEFRYGGFNRRSSSVIVGGRRQSN